MLGLSVSLQTSTGNTNDVIALSTMVEWEGTQRVQTVFLNVAGDAANSGVTLKNKAMDAAPIGITIADASHPDEPLIYVNDGFVDLTLYPREELLGQNCRFLQGEETREEPVAKMRAAIDAEESVTVELRNYRKDGSMFWNRVSIIPIESESGDVSHYFGFQEDITDTKLYEQEKTLFEKQAEVAKQAMFITDRQGVIEYVNPAFERNTGYSATEALGRTPAILKSGKQADAFYEELWETITAGDVWEGRLTNETKWGELYEVELTIVPITDDHGTITHYAAIERDITETVLRDQALNVLNRVLRHNLRTAVEVIEGHTELLESDLDDIDRHAAITAIQNQTASMKKIATKTDRIRKLWEKDGPGEVWDSSHMKSLVQTYRDRYPDAEIDLQLDITTDLQLPHGELFDLAFEEAIDNAVTHTDQTTPKVTITVSQIEDADRVQITVADNGSSIPESEREIIHEGIEEPLLHGSGIGLWVMEWVTTSLGGEFTIIPTDSMGTVLTFQLPCNPPK